MLEDNFYKLRLSEFLVRAALLGLCFYYFIQLVLMIYDPSLFHEEERSLFRYHSGAYLGKDLIFQYLNASVSPPLYDLPIRAYTYFNSNIQRYFDFYVLVCLILTLMPVALIGLFVSGTTTSLILVLFILIQPIYSYQITSATAHSLAYPILFWCIYFLMRKTYVCLSALCVIASAVYFPMAVTVGLCLASLFIVDAIVNFENSKKSLVRKLILVGTTGLGSLALIKYQLQPISGFGIPLEAFENTEMYPENGASGRHYSTVTHPAIYVLTQALNQFKDFFSVSVKLFIFTVYAVISLIVLVTSRSMKGWFGLVMFVFVGIAVYSTIAYYKPGVSYRYLIYPLFAVLPILFVNEIASKLNELENTASSRRNSVLALSFLVIPLLVFDSSNRDKMGFINKIDRSTDGLMYFVENSIIDDALIASWPYQIETEYIPYISTQSTLVLGKAHNPTHITYLMEMRKRTFALADAYLGDDFSGLKYLKCEFNVDYFIVDLRLLEDPISNLVYFAPFDKYVRDQLQLKQGAPFAMLDIPDSWVVFSNENYRVIDMGSVVSANSC